MYYVYYSRARWDLKRLSSVAGTLLVRIDFYIGLEVEQIYCVKADFDENSFFLSYIAFEKPYLERKSSVRKIDMSGTGVKMNMVREGVLVAADILWREARWKKEKGFGEEMGKKT